MKIHLSHTLPIRCFFILCLPSMLTAQLSVTITATNITCFGATNGQAKANPTGGIAPYTYKWSNNSTAQSIQNLAPDLYKVTVTDANQSTKVASVNITQPTQLGLTIFGQSQICAIAPDGMVACVPFGGTPPYTYLWSNGGAAAQITNLVGGIYTVTVTDTKGCTKSGFFEVGFWDEGLWLMSTSTPYQCAYNTGSAHVSPGSGTDPYQYLWSNGATDSTIDSIDSGTYLVTVTDASGCSNTAEIFVTSNTWLSVFAQIPTPFCLNANANFQEKPAPPIYPQRLWTLSDTLDQIISGQGTDTIQVHWASTGAKTVKYQFGANGIFCSSTTYGLQVAVCADANEPALDGVRIGPNPFAASIQVEFLEGLPMQAEAILTDLSGKVLLSQRLQERNSALQTAQIPAGYYFLKIISKNGGETWKLTKN